MDTVMVKWFLDAADFGDFRQAQAKVVIFGALKLVVDAAGLLEHRTPNEPKMEGHKIEK